MRLGEFIEQLANCERDAGPDTQVKFSDGRNPRAFYSYRGYYEQLTLAPDGGRDFTATVGWLHDRAKECVGKTFTGYKGGDYVMHESTPLWAEDYGDSHEHAVIVGVSWNPTTNLVVIHRVCIPEEYLYG